MRDRRDFLQSCLERVNGGKTMQKLKLTLLSSVVSVTGVFVSAAQAEEWDARIGGYYNAMIAYAGADTPGTEDFNGADTVFNGEVHFAPEITLDNGLKIGANIQLEADNDSSGDYIDEAFLFIRGSFGEILLGQTDSAGYKMTFGAPVSQNWRVRSEDGGVDNFTYQVYTGFFPVEGFRDIGGSFVGFGNDYERGTLGSTFIENDGQAEAGRISYFSPRFAGFQLGVSYARDNSSFSNNTSPDCNTRACNYFDIGANYVESFGDFNVAVSGRWGIADAPPAATDDPTVSGFGINLGFGDVVIGGSYAEQNGTRFSDGEAYEIGASYEVGDIRYSLNYFKGNNIDNELVFIGSGNEKEEIGSLMIEAARKWSKNIEVGVQVTSVDFDEDFSDNGTGTGDDVSGVSTGLFLSGKF